jgi:adenylate cyclase
MLRSLELLYRFTPQEFNQARVMFLRSIELDTSYAVPHALSALWHSIRVNQGWSPARAEHFAAVSKFAGEALDSDPLDARALSRSGHLRVLLFRDFAGAFALFDRAIQTSPNSAFAWARSSPLSAVSETERKRATAPTRHCGYLRSTRRFPRLHRTRPRCLHP